MENKSRRNLFFMLLPKYYVIRTFSSYFTTLLVHLDLLLWSCVQWFYVLTQQVWAHLIWLWLHEHGLHFNVSFIIRRELWQKFWTNDLVLLYHFKMQGYSVCFKIRNQNAMFAIWRSLPKQKYYMWDLENINYAILLINILYIKSIDISDNFYRLSIAFVILISNGPV